MQHHLGQDGCNKIIPESRTLAPEDLNSVVDVPGAHRGLGSWGKLVQMSNPRDCWGVQDNHLPNRALKGLTERRRLDP